MIKQVRKIKTINKRQYVYELQKRQKIKRYINVKGYVCYDTDEFMNYKKSAKLGRPANKE